MKNLDITPNFRLKAIATLMTVLILLLSTSCKKDEEENPNPVKVTFSTSSDKIDESSKSVVTITAKLDKPSPIAGKVVVKLSGTAAYGQDYTTIPIAVRNVLSISFAKGDTEKKITIRPKNNSDRDGDKIIKLELAKVTGGVTLGDGKKSIEITITDDDKDKIIKQKVTLFASENEIRENSDKSASLDITSDKNLSDEGTLEIVLSGNAKYGQDYTTEPIAEDGKIKITIPKGNMLEKIKLIPKDNSEKDGDRSVVFTMTNSTGGIKFDKDAEPAKITIIDDESVSDSPKVNFKNENEKTKINEDNAFEYPILVELDKEAKEKVSIDITISGSATNGKDYITIPSAIDNKISITFEKGSNTTKDIAIQVVGNEIKDGDRTIKFEITKATGGVEIGNDKIIELTIVDNDNKTPTKPKISLYNSSGLDEISENATTGLGITAGLDKPAKEKGTLEITLSGTASYDKDYTTTPKATQQKITFTFEIGESMKTIMLSPENNKIPDGNRTVILQVTKAEGGIQLGSKKDNKMIATITDDDSTSPKLLEASIYIEGADRISESSKSKLDIFVELEKGLTEESGSIEVTLSGVAMYNKDYNSTPKAIQNKITIPLKKGEQKKTISIRPIDNDKKDGDRKLNLEITKVVGGMKISSLSKAVEVTITDDDNTSSKLPKVGIQTNEISINENSNKKLKIKVKLDKKAENKGSIEITLSGTATYSQDYTSSPVAINKKLKILFNKGESEKIITIGAKDNDKKDGDRNITLEITKATGLEIDQFEKAVDISIIDDDNKNSSEREIIIYAVQTEVSESSVDPLDVLIAINGGQGFQKSTPVEITFSGSAKYNNDYTTKPPKGAQNKVTVVFKKGELEKNIKIKIKNNKKKDGDRTIKIEITKVTGAKIGFPKTANVTIKDDD